jgi:aminoglycoside 3-N-acetyltransferase
MGQPKWSFLTEQWKSVGVCEGDVQMLHSSISRTLKGPNAKLANLTPSDVLKSFLDALGTDGTLIVPLFNFDFADGVPFDIRRTPSKMGALTECARLWDGAVRTGNPIYSFAVIGRHAALFHGLNNKSGYGDDSPFAVLRDLDGVIGALDLEENESMTFHHFVEESCRVSYRYFKSFTGLYTDENGVTCEREYVLYVRDVESGVETYANPAGELLWKAGLYVGDRPGVGSGLRLIRSRAMFQFMEKLIRDGHALGNLYRILPKSEG